MPPIEEESPPLHAGWGWGSCVATALTPRHDEKGFRQRDGGGQELELEG